jgi:hypothetical protein
MRGIVAALGVVAGATWSVGAGAQQQWGAPQLPPPPPPPSATVQRLDQGDNADSYRRLELVYVNAEVGGAYANLNQTGPIFPGSQGGVAFGLGAGLRFVFFTIGARGRAAPFSGYTLYEANLEAGFHLPLGAWDPYINLHGGYAAAHMNAEPAATILGTTVSYTPPSPSGGDFGGSLGADYYVTSLFSVGIDFTLDGLFMSTSAAYLTGTQIQISASESSTGIAFLGSLHAGLHFTL